MTGSDTRRRRTLGGAFWLALYVGLSLLPLAIAFTYRDHPRRPFWTEFSVALGFVALAMMGLQFAVTARFRNVAAPYGIDIILRFHKQISIVAGALVLAHPIILFVTRPETIELLDPLTAPWRARFAVAATVAVLALIGISVWRRRLRLPYEAWRLAHGLLATAAVAFALTHVELVGWYVDLPWKKALWAAMALAVIGLLIYVRFVVPSLLLRRPWVVDQVVPERGRAWTLFLRPVGHRRNALRARSVRLAHAGPQRVRRRGSSLLFLVQRHGQRADRLHHQERRRFHADRRRLSLQELPPTWRARTAPSASTATTGTATCSSPVASASRPS